MCLMSTPGVGRWSRRPGLQMPWSRRIWLEGILSLSRQCRGSGKENNQKITFKDVGCWLGGRAPDL